MVSGDFAAALAGEAEVEISVQRAGSGKKRTLPVWFTVEGDKLELLPMYGLKTRWFQSLEKSGTLEVRAKGATRKASPKIVRDPDVVERAKARFSKKYGVTDVKRYYPTSEVLLEIRLQ